MESRSRLRIVVFKIICILYRSNGMKILGLSDLGIYESASLDLCANLLFTNYGLKHKVTHITMNPFYLVGMPKIRTDTSDHSLYT